MATKIFVNLAVKDLEKSMAFFKTLGFTFNPQFTDATAACMVISEHIYSMLLTEEKFRGFSKKPIVDTSKANEVMTALSFESKDAVNRIVDAAVAAGGTEPRPPMDFGFMYGRSFTDLDGHIWEPFWMDPKHVQKQ
jgi:predicted lactoylglutathione lyase